MNYIYNRDVLIRFYKILKKEFTDFENLTLERKEQIDSTMIHWYNYFQCKNKNLRTLISYTAEKLTTSTKFYDLRNGDEIAYFYIQIVDPKLLFLECYESGNNKDEIKNLCQKNFRIYDGFLIMLENKLNKKLPQYEEMYELGRIKR